MRTRDVLDWNWKPADLLELARLCVLGAVLVALDGACTWLEAYIDRGGGAGPPTTSAETGAGESQGPRGFGDRITHRWRLW